MRGRIPKGHNRAEINIGPKLMHTKMKDNRDLCLPWVQNTHQTHTGCGIPGSTAQVKDVGVLVDRKSHMTQQWEGEASKTSYCSLHSGGTMSKGGGRYSQVSWHPGNGIQAWKPQRARGADSLLGSGAAVGVEGGPSLLLGLHHSSSFAITKAH